MCPRNRPKTCYTHKGNRFSSLKEIFTGVTSLVDEKISLTPNFSTPIIVPFRNAIFLSAAVAYSCLCGCNVGFMGLKVRMRRIILIVEESFMKHLKKLPSWERIVKST